MTSDSLKQQLRADMMTRAASPRGIKLLRTLRGHPAVIGRIAWSPDGRMLACPSRRYTRLWDANTWQSRHILNQESFASAFDPAGRILAVLGAKETRLWDPASGKPLRSLASNAYGFDIAWSPDGREILTPYSRGVSLFDAETGGLVRRIALRGTLTSCAWSAQTGMVALAAGDAGVRICDEKLISFWEFHADISIDCVAWSQKEQLFAFSSSTGEIYLWTVELARARVKLIATLEGHTAGVTSLSFSFDGKLLASKSADQTVRVWRRRDFECVAVIKEETAIESPFRSLAFHPRLPLLATVGSDQAAPPDARDRLIHIWELDLDDLLGKVAEPSVHYVNAKVVLVGDTGVGKTGLSLVLNKQPFAATDSTPGRRVWTFDSSVVNAGGNVTQIREALLWDLAGQPGYRVIHQLHLGEVAVALVVFDARSEIDPLAGVRHWARALLLAEQRQVTLSVPMKKLLVSARNDRGGVAIGEERLQALLSEFGFDGFFKTSAKEGWEITELRAAVMRSIPWDKLPEVSSSQLFADIKAFLLEVKKTGRLLEPARQLYDEFVGQHRETAARTPTLRGQFETCIGRMENRDLIRRLTFGGYVLLQPELLDAYASAMVNTARDEPDGLGSLAEEIALAGKFFVPEEQKVLDFGQEQLLLHATIEELVRHDLALRENANDGRYLVFPSQFSRDYEDAPEPKGKIVAITFDGPVQSLYSALAVRLGHSGLFTSGRAEMWRNAAVFRAKAGGKCGLFLQEFAEARGRLTLFFDEGASDETRFHFEDFVVAHAQHRALEGTVTLVRFFVCPDCGDPVPDNYVKRLRDRGELTFSCPCGGRVPLAEPKERLHFPSEVAAMERYADRQRDFDAFVVSARGETSTKSFQEWAGGERVTLAIVFTDVVGSTALGEEIRDERMSEVRRMHFSQSRGLIDRFHGREIKTIGDSFMTAFRSVDAALDYTRALHENTGHKLLQIRAGIHIGPMQVEESDVFGGTVNFAARVVGAIEGAEVWLSESAKEDIDRLGAAKHSSLRWERHEDVAMKGFPGEFTLWSLKG